MSNGVFGRRDYLELCVQAGHVVGDKRETSIDGEILNWGKKIYLSISREIIDIEREE